MSGTSQSAELGADLARERYPGARISLVDSTSNSMQEGFAVSAAAECAATGGDLAACEAAALASVARSRFLFTPRSLDNLARGGRISSAAALMGGALRIVPILTASGGTTGVAGVVRTRTQAMRRMAAIMRRDIERCGVARAVVQVVADADDAARFAREWIEPVVGRAVQIVPVPASVGIHVGPAIGVAYETVDPLR
jgi:DegV family protein with EDD domain